MAYVSRFDTNGNSVGNKIFQACETGLISFRVEVVEGTKRLDHYAFQEYGDGLNWWVIAAASGIGWWLQVTPGTRLRIPTDINDIIALTS
jgi:hypothetical protein